MNRHERRIEELEHELADAKRHATSLRQRVYGRKRPYDPIREAELQRNVEGAGERLDRERARGSGGTKALTDKVGATRASASAARSRSGVSSRTSAVVSAAGPGRAKK